MRLSREQVNRLRENGAPGREFGISRVTGYKIFNRYEDPGEDRVWLVSVLDYDPGFFDTEKGRVEPAPDPFLPDRLLTMCPE